MTGLLVLGGVLLVVSGTVKIRSSARAKLGVPLLAVVELVTGAALSAVSVVAPPTVETGFRMVLGAVALVLASSGTMAARVARARRERESSEGSRLVTYVKYLSKQGETGE